MKTASLLLLFFITSIGFAQNNHIVKTDDGRRVLLKADFTWEYIDAEVPVLNNAIEEKAKTVDANGCNIAQGFEEPELDNNIQTQLKKGRATINHIKQKVAKDYKCQVEDVILLSVSEDKAKGAYDFCANGNKVTYKRNGFTIIKSRKLF